MRKAEPRSLYPSLSKFNIVIFVLFLSPQVRYPVFLVLIVIQIVMVTWLWSLIRTVNHLSITYYLKHRMKTSHAQLDDNTPRCFLSVEREKCCPFIVVCCTQSRYLPTHLTYLPACLPSLWLTSSLPSNLSELSTCLAFWLPACLSTCLCSYQDACTNPPSYLQCTCLFACLLV